MATASFPRWLSAAGEAAAAAAASAATAEAPTADSSCGSARTVLERVVAVTNDSGSSSSGCSDDVSASSRSPSSSDYVLAYHVPLSDLQTSASSFSDAREAGGLAPLVKAADGHFAAEFQNNWPLSHSAVIDEEMTPPSCTSNSSFVRELVVKFASDSVASLKPLPEEPPPLPPLPITGGDSGGCVVGDVSCCPARSFPVWREAPGPRDPRQARCAAEALTICSNTNQTEEQPVVSAAKSTATPAASPTAAAAVKAPDKPPAASSKQDNSGGGGGGGGAELREETCRESCSPLRAAGLVLYYLLLWAFTIAFTWLLLEISLMVTSKGKFPYYMSPHSFCLKSPRVGFVGTDPEPGKVTEFSGLQAMLDRLLPGLQKAAAADQQLRDCDAPAAASVTAVDQLEKPCNLSAFAAAAETKLRALLKDRPAVLVQIRRHIGYLPKSGPQVKIDCTATASGGSGDLPLRYYSWTGSAIAESAESGSVPTSYFPMLTSRHSVPSVLVAVDSSTKSDWLDKKLTVTCRPADGGEQKPERQVILLVKG